MQYETVPVRRLVQASLIYSGLDEFTTDVRRIGHAFKRIQLEGEQYFPQLSELFLRHLKIDPNPKNPSHDIWSRSLQTCFNQMSISGLLRCASIFSGRYPDSYYHWGADIKEIRDTFERDLQPYPLTPEQKSALERFGKIVRKEMAYQPAR